MATRVKRFLVSIITPPPCPLNSRRAPVALTGRYGPPRQLSRRQREFPPRRRGLDGIGPGPVAAPAAHGAPDGQVWRVEGVSRDTAAGHGGHRGLQGRVATSRLPGDLVVNFA